MARGLQALFGLDDPQQDFPNDLSKKFSLTFKKEMKVAADATAFTVQNGEEKAHEGLVRRGEEAYGDYRDTQEKIGDGAGEKDVKQEIKEVLDTTKALAGDAGKLKAAIEAAKQAWEAKAAEKNAADGRIDELDQWGHKNAPKLLQIRQKIDGDAGARRWAAATKTVEALVAKPQPLYEEFQKQKQAKADYDKERPAFDKDFLAAEGYPEATPKIEEMTGLLGSKLVEASVKAEEKDYVAALEVICSRKDPLSKLTAAIEAHKKLKQDFLDAQAKIVPPADEAAKAVPQSLQADFGTRDRRDGGVEESARTYDYETGLTRLKDLEAHHKEYDAKYQAYLQQKKDYEDGLKDLEPQLEAVSEAVESQTIQEQQAQIAENETAMKQAAEAGDYGSALEQMKPLQSDVPACQAAIDKYKEQKKAYEERLTKLAPRLEKAKETVKNDLLLKGQAKIAEVAGDMTASAEAGDYEAALSHMDRVEPILDGFEQHKADVEAQRKEYEERLKAAAARIEKAKQSGVMAGRTGKSIAALDSQLAGVKATAANDDFGKALEEKDELELSLTMCEGGSRSWPMIDSRK